MFLALSGEGKKKKLLLDLKVFQSNWRDVTQALSWAVADLGPVSSFA